MTLNYSRIQAVILKMPYYAVRRGKVPGVYENWDAAKLQVQGCKDAVHKKYVCLYLYINILMYTYIYI